MSVEVLKDIRDELKGTRTSKGAIYRGSAKAHPSLLSAPQLNDHAVAQTHY
jgi:hypothetical protein